jgi:two-component system response regulator YesN
MRPCSPPLQEQVRKHIGRHVALPPAESNLSSGCSTALLARVSAFVDDYYYLPLSTQLMAWGLGFEPSYFAKMFKRFSGISLAKYLKRVRLTRAKKLLEDPYLSIVEISDRTGFTDASYFTRVFHSEFGITPSRFRQLTGDNP